MAFTGLRVLDLSSSLSGAYAARLFADFGADVVLIELPGRGHALRDEPPFVEDRAGKDRSILHGIVNWNKRSVVTDDPKLVCDLAAAADLLVTTAARSWSSLETEAAASLRGSAVHLSVTPHGLDGPLAAAPGNNLTACALTGWCKINGVHDKPPLQLPVRLTGYVAGIAAFVGAAAALFRGTSEVVDVSETEAMATTNAPWAKFLEFSGAKPGKYKGNCQFGGKRRLGEAGPLLWPARDGAIHFAFGDWVRWDDAMRLLGLDELVNSKYSPVWGRHSLDRAPVSHRLAVAAKDQSKWDMFYGLVQNHCVAGVVQDASELLESEQLRARGFLVDTTVAGMKITAPGPVAQLSESPWSLRCPAPALGTTNGSTLVAEWTTAAAREESVHPRHTDTSLDLPLKGIRVLTFTQAWSGPWATTLLALLGADVVQIESRQRPDVWRGAGVGTPAAVKGLGEVKVQDPLNCNGMYNSVNFGKRAITLDLKSERGRKLFWRLVPKFDVVVENFAPHVMESWGITLEALHAVKPALIFASVSAYGEFGPLALYPGNGNSTEPMAGISAINGYPSGEPCSTGGLCPDPVSGYYLCASILAALYHLKRTGRGQRVSAAMIEAVACTAPADAIAEYSANASLRRPAGNRHPRFAPHNIYSTSGKHEWIALTVETDGAWAALANHAAIGDDPRFRTNVERKMNEDELDDLLAQHCADKDAEAEAATLRALGVAAVRVADFVDTFTDPSPQWRHRGFLQKVTHPETGTHMMSTVPWRLKNTAPQQLRYSPRFGEHCRDVLQEDLGINDVEFAELEAAGITGSAFLGLGVSHASPNAPAKSRL